jgi:hypothetical protein
MDGMKPPNLPEQPIGVIRAEQLVRLLKTCEGRDFKTCEGRDFTSGVTPPSSCC